MTTVSGAALATMPDVNLPPLTVARMFTSWTLDPAMVLPIIAAGALYLWGVRVLRRRGDTWERSRVVYWFVGLAIIFVATSSALGVYDRVLFSVPAIQHMLLQMIAPVPLVLGAPMRLAMRTLPKRGRALLLAVVHSAPARFLAHPAITFLLFSVSQFVFYYTPLYDWSLTNVWAHDLSHVHFVLAGFLFYWSLLGVDPVPHRPPFVFRFVMVVGLGPVHILLGIPIMMMATLVSDFYVGAGRRSWGPTPLADQQIGGGVLWGFGDVAAAVLVGAFLRQWYRSDEREARRMDRQLDRAHGESATVTPWWLLEEGDKSAELLGPQRDSERTSPRKRSR
ncbi:cytochrome c oxidase assembly protein [Lentzea sp. BCCO 10_0061]|uniref:Cytochrome c oxidase assembly protein n=1 Tax=Lentzea sokolovensis TaxID=3095429 RepID=A0ABU4UUQ6_9PSEU|nr:cytochrome c oxidase assembly protein [Lentzea sp. BCCO 10_0061]MDX8143245.1 cytochrome c oxidase assembly protein [Lentzea sp. BCCO 10_0061]